MLSILIPVYKQEISPFVRDLESAAIKLNIEFEIIIMDDGSGADYSICDSNLLSHSNIELIKLPENVGRAEIRNKLSEVAEYSNLLYLDADGQLINNDFIVNYLPYLNQSKVFSGGRKYSDHEPENKAKFLHWKYGTKYESKPAQIRNESAYHSFHSNNFLVPKRILLEFPFDKHLITYGYEDSLWANELKKDEIAIQHIENPIIHLGVEEAEIFLLKINSSIDNLVKLSTTDSKLNLPLEKLYSFIYTVRCHQLFAYIFSKIKRRIVQNLLGNTPKIWLLQIYKLGLYSEKKASL
ncbi:MAG: glycosyltransferase family 2 protein [Saprospiraceae bacterium]